MLFFSISIFLIVTYRVVLTTHHIYAQPLYFMGTVFSMLFSGYMLDRYGARRIAAFGNLLCIIAISIFYKFYDFEHLCLLSAFLQGIAGAIVVNATVRHGIYLSKYKYNIPFIYSKILVILTMFLLSYFGGKYTFIKPIFYHNACWLNLIPMFGHLLIDRNEDNRGRDVYSVSKDSDSQENISWFKAIEHIIRMPIFSSLPSIVMTACAISIVYVVPHGINTILYFRSSISKEVIYAFYTFGYLMSTTLHTYIVPYIGVYRSFILCSFASSPILLLFRFLVTQEGMYDVFPLLLLGCCAFFSDLKVNILISLSSEFTKLYKTAAASLVLLSFILSPIISFIPLMFMKSILGAQIRYEDCAFLYVLILDIMGTLLYIRYVRKFDLKNKD